MPLTCPNCRRVNPPEAFFCHHDGFALSQTRVAGHPDAAAAFFPHPFVFPSGRSCRDYDQLALACLNEWAVALDLLKHGDLTNFLAGLGRADLARAAREAARSPDPDRGLDQFLSLLPTKTLDPPKLYAEPLQVNLGQIAAGKDFRWDLHLSNQGMRLLSGTIACADCVWLALGEGGGSPRKVFQFHHDAVIPVQVRGKQLRAGAKPIVGRLRIESNGGSAVVVVTAEVPVKPFPDGVLAGAKSPRQIAEKAKAKPKEAAALFEKGAVVRWYLDNGWEYPVRGPQAAGLGAVQQFFEALGLTAPPKVQVREQALHFTGRVGESLKHVLEVEAVEKRPVYASAVSDQPWLQVSRVEMGGRVASIRLSVPAVPDRPGETLQARLTVRANGNQRFLVPVTLAVGGKRRPAREAEPVYQVVEELEEIPAAPDTATPWRPADAVAVNAGRRKSSPVLDALPEVVDDDGEEEDEPREPMWRRFKGLLWAPVAFLALGLLVAVVRDLIAYFSSFSGPQTGLIALQFHDTAEQVLLGSGAGGVKGGGAGDEVEGIWDPSMRFGLVMANQRDPRDPSKHKRLTFEEKGLTNNTVVKLDGSEWIFGEKPFHTSDGEKAQGVYPGRWTTMAGDLGYDAARVKRQGKRSVWYYDNEQIQVTQTVELVAGDQSGQLDTCVVRYLLENQDKRAHNVGLRFLLDTFIGANDGVPFLIPGANQLCDTSIDERDPNRIPQYIQACESQDLAHPGTIARIQFRLGPAVEPPERVTLGSWPDPRLMARDQRCKQEKTLWEVPVFPINTLGDSAVVMYWNEKELPPGKSREVGFAYGLGEVAGGEGGGKIGLTVGGSFSPGGEISVTAYVSAPKPGETVTLALPPGFQLAGGDLTQSVPATAAGTNSPVSWKVKAGRAGEYVFKVESSGGASQTKKVVVKTSTIFGSN